MMNLILARAATVPTRSSGQRLALITEQWLGEPFLPGEACRSQDFVQAMLAIAGISRGELLPEAAEPLLLRGDVLAFDLSELPGHAELCVGIYLGSGLVAHRPVESPLVGTFRFQDYGALCVAAGRPRYRGPERTRSRAPVRLCCFVPRSRR